MIKLLALDLDGTLLNSRGEIPEKNIEAIQKAEAKGARPAPPRRGAPRARAGDPAPADGRVP